MRYTLLVALLLMAAPAGAQTVEATLDLTALGWGELDTPQSIETDGDLSTREWLIRPVVNAGVPMFRIVAERDGRACAGPWFNANGSDAAFSFLTTLTSVQRVGLVHKLVVRQMGSSVVTVLALDTPVCSDHD